MCCRGVVEHPCSASLRHVPLYRQLSAMCIVGSFRSTVIARLETGTACVVSRLIRYLGGELAGVAEAVGAVHEVRDLRLLDAAQRRKAALRHRHLRSGWLIDLVSRMTMPERLL